MSKRQTPRDIQVMHRLSGARMIGVNAPVPATMAIDARPRAGDPRPLGIAKPAGKRDPFGDEEAPPVVTEIDDE